MEKREQIRSLLDSESSSKWVVALMTTTLIGTLQLAAENEGWLSRLFILVAVLVSIPAFKKDWERENIKKKYLESDQAKRSVHFPTIFGMVAYPLIIMVL